MARWLDGVIPSLQKDSPRLFSPSPFVLLLYCTGTYAGSYMVAGIMLLLGALLVKLIKTPQQEIK